MSESRCDCRDIASHRSPAPVGSFDQRNPKRGCKEQFCAAEIARRDADDGEWMLIDVDRPANNASVLKKMTAPVCIAQHDVGSAVDALLIRGMEKAPQIWLDAEPIEVIAADHVGPCCRRASRRYPRPRGP